MPIVPPPAPKLRLNPFAFISDTDFRFALLVIATIGASLFVYDLIGVGDSVNLGYGTSITACLEQWADFDPSGFLSQDPEVLQTFDAFRRCQGSAEARLAAFVLLSVLVLLALTTAIWWVLPMWRIRRLGFVPLTEDDLPQVVGYLRDLCREAQLGKPPVFLWNPLDSSIHGLAFGRPRKHYIGLSGGLVNQYFGDWAAFRAVVLHELAHLRNADVDKTYFSVSVWYAFVLAALVPLVLTTLSQPLAWGLAVGWRVAALALLVFLIRSAVLRSREVYADVRVSTWETYGRLERSLAALSSSTRGRIARAFETHPTPDTRLAALKDTLPLFRADFWTGAVAGVAIGMVAPNLELLLNSLFFSSAQSYSANWINALLLAPFLLGTVGAAVWRATFASRTSGIQTWLAGPVALGIGLGFATGYGFSFRTATGIYARTTAGDSSSALLGIVEAAFTVGWFLLLLLVLFLFFRWLVTCSCVWLDSAVQTASPGRYQLLVLGVASLQFATWFGFFIFMREIGVTTLGVAAVGIAGFLTQFAMRPLTLAATTLLWALPFAAWFATRKAPQRGQAPWYWLDRTSDGSPPFAPVPLKPRLSLVTGAAAGLASIGVVLGLRLVMRAVFPEDVRNADDFRMAFFYGQLGIAMVFQMLAAFVAAVRIKPTGTIHGLLAAFVAGTIGAAGLLGLNLLFGGSIDAQFAWTTFSTAVNGGAVAALPAALFAAFLARRR